MCWAGGLIGVPSFSQNGCDSPFSKWIQSVFKTAAFDRSATPPKLSCSNIVTCSPI